MRTQDWTVHFSVLGVCVCSYLYVVLIRESSLITNRPWCALLEFTRARAFAPYPVPTGCGEVAQTLTNTGNCPLNAIKFNNNTTIVLLSVSCIFRYGTRVRMQQGFSLVVTALCGTVPRPFDRSVHKYPI